MPSRKAAPQILEDVPFHERQWIVQRAGWLVALLLLMLSMAGLFGDGPLSRATVGEAPLHVAYQRFLRRDAPMRLDVTAQAAQDGKLRLAISRAYLTTFEINSIVPEPERTDSGVDELIFVFPASASGETVTVTFDGTARHLGRHQGLFRNDGLPEHPVVRISQFTYP